MQKYDIMKLSKNFKGGIQMLDAQGRITIGKKLLSNEEYIVLYGEANIFYEPIQKIISLRSKYIKSVEGMYLVATHKVDKKGRIFIPMSIRNAFPGATYLPAEKNGRIYILIIEHEKKSE